jgi:hypothetical protein
VDERAGDSVEREASPPPAPIDGPSPALIECLTSAGHTAEVLASARARLPLPRATTSTYGSIHAFIVLGDRLTGGRRMAETVDQLRTAGFPVAARMILVATAESLLVVEAAGRAWRPVRVVGRIPRSALASLTLPYLDNNRWKLARLVRRSGRGVQVRIDRDEADALVAQFA